MTSEFVLGYPPQPEIVLNEFIFYRGVLLPGAPKPRYLINKLIKQQEQIYHLQL